MHKRSLGARLSSNPVRISLIEKEERRRTQTLKSRTGSGSDETHIPRPRVRSSSVDANGRKSGIKPPAKKSQAQYGFYTPQSGATTPSHSQASSTVRLRVTQSGSTIRGRSPSAERASNMGVKSARKDNRPLGEKLFQNEMLGKIDSYMSSIQQSSLLNSNGSLKPITLKMFVEVSDLLVKLLDVKHNLTILNYVEELPKIAKKLHYPGLITKSWLKTANAMHSWPQVLGWLSWLAETCMVKDLASEHLDLNNLPFIEAENAQDLNKIKFHFLLDAYNAWNEEKPSEETALTDNYLQKIANTQGVTEADIENAIAMCETESLRLKDAKEKGHLLDDEIKGIEETLRSLRVKETQQESYLKELEDREKKYLKDTSRLEEEEKIIDETLKQQKLRQEELRAQINSQPMSVVQRDEIVERCSVMKNQMHELNVHLTDIEKEIYTLDIKLASARNNLNKVVFAYNKDIYLHFDKEADVDLDDIAMPVTGIPNPDIMDELQRKAGLMHSFQANMEKQIESIESMIQSDQRKLVSLEEEKTTLQRQKEEHFSKTNENKNRIKEIQAAAKAEENELRESIENLRLNIKDIQSKMPNVEQEEKELAEFREKIDAVRRRKTYLEDSAKLFFGKFFEILALHKNRLARIFDKSESFSE